MAINTPPIRDALPITGQPGNQFASWPKSWANWLNQVWAVTTTLNSSGTTANRPTENLWVGRFYFDTSLGIPIWYDGTNWIDATGSTV